MDAGEVRRQLLQWVELTVILYDEITSIYRGWFQDSLLAGAKQNSVDEYERRMVRHLRDNQSRVSDTVNAAVRFASESARELTGDDFHSKTTQNARRDLEALVSDEIQRRIVAQLRRDQSTLVQRRARERLRQLTDQGFQVGISLSPDMEHLLYRPDTLGRRRNSKDYVRVETVAGLFSLVNNLTYALLLQRGDTVCTLDHALDGAEIIKLSDFLQVQEKRMHPRSTLLIHSILES